MGCQVKLPNIDFAKVGNTLGQASRTAVKFVGDHKPEFLTGAFFVAVADNIRIRLGRKKDQKAFEENAVKQQKVLRKHEAEINVLKVEAEQAQDAKQKVDQLEQIVKSITEGGASV